LVRLEEQPVHVGQLNFVVVEQDELEEAAVNAGELGEGRDVSM
jgi:hypothetical protein